MVHTNGKTKPRFYLLMRVMHVMQRELFRCLFYRINSNHVNDIKHSQQCNQLVTVSIFHCWTRIEIEPFFYLKFIHTFMQNICKINERIQALLLQLLFSLAPINCIFSSLIRRSDFRIKIINKQLLFTNAGRLCYYLLSNHQEILRQRTATEKNNKTILWIYMNMVLGAKKPYKKPAKTTKCFSYYCIEFKSLWGLLWFSLYIHFVRKKIFSHFRNCYYAMVPFRL